MFRCGTGSVQYVDRERDQVLLHALVWLALDPVPVGIGSQDETLPGHAQLRDIVAQAVGRFPQYLGMPSLQRDRPPGPRLQEVVRHRTGGVNRPSTPL
jgi:hypothetical protein